MHHCIPTSLSSMAKKFYNIIGRARSLAVVGKVRSDHLESVLSAEFYNRLLCEFDLQFQSSLHGCNTFEFRDLRLTYLTEYWSIKQANSMLLFGTLSVQLVSILSALDLTKQEKMMLLVCTETTKSRTFELESSGPSPYSEGLTKKVLI